MLKTIMTCDDRVYDDMDFFISDLSTINAGISNKNGLQTVTNQDINFTITFINTITAFPIIADLEANLDYIIIYDKAAGYGPYSATASLKGFSTSGDVYQNGVQYQVTVTCTSQWMNSTPERASATHSAISFEANDSVTMQVGTATCNFDFSNAGFNGQTMLLSSDGVISSQWDAYDIDTSDGVITINRPPANTYLSGQYLNDSLSNWRALLDNLQPSNGIDGLTYFTQSSQI